MRAAFHCTIGPKILSHRRGAALHRSAHPIWTLIVSLRRTHNPLLCLTLFLLLRRRPRQLSENNSKPPLKRGGDLKILIYIETSSKRAIRALEIKFPRSPPLDNIEHILTRNQTRSEVSIKVKLEITALLRIGASTLRLATPRSS